MGFSLYILYIDKIDPKIGHKMVKNGLIKLIFLPDVFLWVLLVLQRILKFFENWSIFGEKTAILCIFRVCYFNTRYSRNNALTLWKIPLSL